MADNKDRIDFLLRLLTADELFFFWELTCDSPVWESQDDEAEEGDEEMSIH